MAEKIVGLKELRENTEAYIAKVREGKSFLVVRKSKPVFKIVPADEDEWETIVDFTAMNPRGIPLEKIKKAITGLLN